MNLLFLLFISLFGSPNTVAGYKIGDKAADFSLKSTDGNMVSMADYPNAKGFIIVFTCNHCPFAIGYENRINALAEKYGPLGYVLLAINPNDPAVQPADSYAMMQVRHRERNFVFPYLFDEGQKVYPLFGATKTPHTFVLDRDKIVQYIGAIDDSAEDVTLVDTKYVENAIAALEAGNKPTPPETKAIGCSIKVKR